MDKPKQLSELTTQICISLIDHGVQPHIAWSDYSSNYRPIVYYAQEHSCEDYNEELLEKYCQSVEARYEKEGFSRGVYRARIRAVERLREYYETGEISHIGKEGFSKKRLNYSNEKLLQDFLVWSELTVPKTLQDADWAVRCYLAWLQKQGHINAMETTAHSFSGFLTMASQKYSEASIYDLQLYLKKFHLFLRQEKGLDIPYEFVLSLPIIREKKIFSPITMDEIQRTISQIDRSTVKGKRDYAIILLAARNGLRGIDIVNLKLTDIDWRRKEIRIIQRKTGIPTALPLLPDVGEALKEYILNGRPGTASSNVFLRCLHPYLPFANAVPLRHLLFEYQKKAGIERFAFDGKGFHSLRRALGKELTVSEIPVTTTAQILGHRNPDSARQYISLDSGHLKECALPLNGIRPESEVYRNV